ncbi:hypothetical protein AB4254_08905 [Vibrio breoganii]
MILSHVSNDLLETLHAEDFSIFIFENRGNWDLIFVNKPPEDLVDIDPFFLEETASIVEGQFVALPDFSDVGSALYGLGKYLFGVDSERSDSYIIDSYELSEDSIWLLKLLTHSSKFYTGGVYRVRDDKE